MAKVGFHTVFSALSNLPIEELLILKQEINRKENQKALEVLTHEKIEETESCPHCSSSKIVKNGSKDGRKRFLCKDCKKSFNIYTNTPLARLRMADKHLRYAVMLLESKTIRDAAKSLGIAISTAFRWRHRFLESLNQLQPSKLNGIVEADETFFKHSYKGQRKGLPRKAHHRGTPASQRGLSAEQVPVLIARERNSATTLSCILPARNAVEVGKVLVPVLPKDSLLCSDGARIYKIMGRANGITVHSHKKARSGLYHIQNTNAACSRLKNWISGNFKGVATKYLSNYLGWIRWMETNPTFKENDLWRTVVRVG